MILVMKDKIEKSKASQPLAPTSRIDTRRALHPHELDAETKARLEEGYQGEPTPHLDHLLR